MRGGKRAFEAVALHPMQLPPWIPSELDVVAIPDAMAREKGVVAIGTIVWCVANAPFATVECTKLGGRPGLDTELVDVPITDLSRHRG